MVKGKYVYEEDEENELDNFYKYKIFPKQSKLEGTRSGVVPHSRVTIISKNL